MAFEEDFAPFFADFGDAAVLAGEPVRVIFDGPGGQLLGMTVESPVVQIASASVPADYAGASLVISTGRGVGTYTVREHTPDGSGLSLLSLAGPV